MGRDMVSIKGTKNGLVIVLDPNREFEEIRNTLLRKMESAKGFFRGAKFSFLQEHHEMPVHQKNELENICRQFGLVPNGEDRTNLRTGLTESSYKKVFTHQHAAATGEAALMVRRSLRSGQRITYPGHIVVLGDIHPGAEVISGGSILVMGSCRGVVHAGMGGNRSAKVIALLLAPTVLSIAGQRYTSDRPGQLPTGCLVAQLVGQKVVFEKFRSGSLTLSC